jgi:hypothetical protein
VAEAGQRKRRASLSDQGAYEIVTLQKPVSRDLQD